MGPATLCMNQYVRMFHSCRLPGDTQDSIELYERSRHIVVLRSNAIYSFDVLDENFELLPTEVIHLQ